ncbi:MAG TPA: Crp/Fnr family transcriptional regulator, partial [Arachidicoccus sp.]
MRAKSYPKASEEDIAYIIQMLGTIYPLSESLQQELYENILTLQLPQNQILLEQGEVCNYIYFIKKGAIMGYSIHNRKKITTYISIENEFVSSITGLHGAAPSKETIVAVIPSLLLAIRNDVIQELLKTHFDLNFIFRVIIEQYYRDAQERAHIVRIGNARERYMYFMQTKSGRIERLPEESIASLLDIKLITLTRLKKQFGMQAVKKQEAEQLFRQIDSYILANQLYKNKKISLASLSAELDITSHKLSSLINDNCHLTFLDYINSNRINSIKEQM